MSESELQVEALNRRFELGGMARVLAGNGGLPKVRITSPLATAEIYLHGAQVTSWYPAGAEEVLFLSEQSHWTAVRAIRGGIPICFPWFRAKADDAQAPAHGFLRTRAWQLDDVSTDAVESVTVSLSTASDDASRRWWPHEFHATYRINVGTQLGLELIIVNAGTSSFRFEEALHTYFKVGNVAAVHVQGLAGAHYLDNTDHNRHKVQSGDVTFNAATDSAFTHAQGALEVADPTLKRTLRTLKANSGTTVVWNPWQQGAAALSDLGNEEWQQMACVEASNILASAVELGPGRSHTLHATISVIPLEAESR